MRMLSLVPVLVVLVLSGVSGAMACQVSPGKTALEKLNDDSITAAVEGEIGGR